MRNVKFGRTVVIAAVMALVMSMTLIACGDKKDEDYTEDEEISEDIDNEDTEDALNTDIDLDALNKSVDSIKNLDLGVDGSGNSDSKEASDESDESDSEPKGEKTVYSYTDVYRDGNNLAVIPNGGMNGSTKLFNDKDLSGFLDYVDSTVLQPGRTINRDFFYDVMATMLVDKDLGYDYTYIEKHMMMALAVSDNFYSTPIKVKECDLNADNATDYSYKLTAYDKDDTWIINYANRTLYMNNGATEYVSEMFKDEYLAVWLMAIDEYFGLN